MAEYMTVTDGVVRRMEIASTEDPDAISYGSGGGAKVPDIPDDDPRYVEKRFEIADADADPDAISYGTGGVAKVPDIPDDDPRYIEKRF